MAKTLAKMSPAGRHQAVCGGQPPSIERSHQVVTNAIAVSSKHDGP